MTHPRKLIRDQVVLALNGHTDAGLNVWASRVLPVWNGRNGLEAVMPSILIYTPSDRAEVFNESPREYRRSLQIAVQLHVLGADVDDPLDAMAEQVEALLLEDETLGGTVSDLRLVDSEFVFSDEGEREMGAARLMFEATYYDEIDLRAEDTLAQIRAGWDLGEPDGQFEAEDDIYPPQEE